MGWYGDGMSEGPPIRRRWFQFSFQATLLLVVLIAVSAFAAREHRRRKQVEAQLNEIKAQMVQQGMHPNDRAKIKTKAKRLLRKHTAKQQTTETNPPGDSAE